MITEFFVVLANTVWGWVASLLPDWEVPAELESLSGLLDQVFALGAGLEPFAVWPLIAVLGAIPLVIWLAGVAWKGLRMVLSHIPLFGGNG